MLSASQTSPWVSPGKRSVAEERRPGMARATPSMTVNGTLDHVRSLGLQPRNWKTPRTFPGSGMNELI